MSRSDRDRTAVYISAQLLIGYAHALRLLRKAQETHAGLSAEHTLQKVRELLNEERNDRKNGTEGEPR